MFRLMAGGLRIIGFALMGLVAVVITWPWQSLVAFCVLGPAIWYCHKLGARNAQLVMDAQLKDEHVPSMSPREYELFVARQLQKAGWAVRHCGKAGDQGCDVVAELRGFRAVVQAKLYRKRVGNAAVQEIVAARRHYSAHIMAVVTPIGYTASAQQLAKSNAVLLINHADLPRLESLARVP